jgi:hypothetical protein
MTNHEERLVRQAAWQKSRQALSWPEKIRQVERIRASIEAFRRERLRQRSLDTPAAAHDSPPNA